jgi:hypothetical protein
MDLSFQGSHPTALLAGYKNTSLILTFEFFFCKWSCGLHSSLVIISSGPSLVTYLNQTPILSGVWLDVD